MPPLLSEPDTASDGDVPPPLINEDMEDVDDDDYDDEEDYDEDGPQEQVCVSRPCLVAGHSLAGQHNLCLFDGNWGLGVDLHSELKLFMPSPMHAPVRRLPATLA